MQIIRAAALKSAPWGNGAGTSRQLAAGHDTVVTLGASAKGAPWDWRISIAEVAKAGPFSELPGVDRIVTVIDGELLALHVDGVETALEKHRTFRFSGDASTTASLPTGAITDLSVMTRRGVAKGFCTIVELSKKRPHPVFAGQYAVLLQGAATVAEPAGAEPVGAAAAAPAEALGRLDTVVGADDAPEVSGRGFLAVVSIDPVDA